MTRFALRGLLGRKLRTTLTALAIVLGVATISGTYVLTDSISNAFDAIFSEIYRSTDASITGETAFDTSANEGGGFAPPFDESLLDEVLALDEVDGAIGGVGDDNVQLVDDEGEAIVFGGAPNLGFSVDPSQPQFNTLTLEEGEWPGKDEVVVDVSTADKRDIEVGSTVGVQAVGPVEDLRVSGLVRFGEVASIGGATLAGFELATAQRLFDKEGKLDQIRVAATEGVSPEELVAAIEPILPPGTKVLSGDQQAATDAEDTNEFLSFLQNFLLAFGGIALFVGAFVIANSLSITIAQRTREFATIRTLGGSRRQVLGSVIVEALVIGALASIVGLFVGLGLAELLFWLFDAVGFTLPNTGLAIEPRTVVVALLVGIGVTLLASLRPAIRATRVPPIAAVREGAVLPEGRFARWRGLGSALLALLGFALLAYGLFGEGLSTTEILVFMGAGTLLVFLGVALFSSRFVRPLAGAIGWPLARIGGVAGTLARQNAQRNPQRTASTAAALMIGLALVTLVAMLAQGIRGTFNDAVDELWITDYAVTAQNDFSPIPLSIGRALRQVPEAEEVVGVRSGQAQIYGSVEFLAALEPGGSQVFSLDWVEGSQEVLEELGTDGAFTDDGYAEDHDLAVGSQVELLSPTGARRSFEIRGIFDPPTGGSPFGPVTIGSAAFDQIVAQPEDGFVFVNMSGGVTDENQAILDEALEPFPNAKAADQQTFKDNQISGLNSILNILYVLLALSVLVSFFGIVNTLVLTVFERTREIGMMRAVGMTRRQLRRMIRQESVITALIGAVIGIVLGIVLSMLLIARVDFIELSWPIGSLIVFTVAAIVVGIVAAVFPARRAARLNPLDALHYE